MRGQRGKQAAAAVQPDGKAAAVIDVSEHKPRRIPSKKWRELIKKVWEADPLLCPLCQKEMRIVALIDDQAVIERILRHLGLWQQGVRVASGPAPPADWVIEPCCCRWRHASGRGRFWRGPPRGKGWRPDQYAQRRGKRSSVKVARPCRDGPSILRCRAGFRVP